MIIVVIMAFSCKSALYNSFFLTSNKWKHFSDVLFPLKILSKSQHVCNHLQSVIFWHLWLGLSDFVKI